MAGHRRAHGRPKRSASRSQQFAERLAAAPTPEARLVAAFDWFRSAVARDGRRRDGGDGIALVRELTDWLTHASVRLERSPE